MTLKNATFGFILPLILMSFCLFFFILPDSLLFPFSFVHLLIVLAYVCILASICKKKGLVKVFMCAYGTIAIPFLIGLIFVLFTSLNLNENIAFILMLGGFVSAIDVVGTIRLFYNPYDPKPGFDILFAFIITAILLIIPLFIYKFTKSKKAKTIN